MVGCMEVIDLGNVGYEIITPVIEEGGYEYNSLSMGYVNSLKKPADLISKETREVVVAGTLSDIKKVAKRKILESKFRDEFVIVGKSLVRPLVVRGKIKE